MTSGMSFQTPNASTVESSNSRNPPKTCQNWRNPPLRLHNCGFRRYNRNLGGRLDPSPKHIPCLLSLAPHFKQLPRCGLYRKGKVVAAKHRRITQVGFAHKPFVVGERDMRSPDSLTVCVSNFELPSITRDELVPKPMLPFVVRQQVCRKAAKGSNFQQRRVASQSA